MAIEYTDVLHDKILKPLQGLIAGEFPGIAIHYKLHLRLGVHCGNLQEKWLTAGIAG